MKKTRAFTLIELLVVVTIIGLIVAIAVVNLINAIQRAKQRKSMGDMRTIALAIESYSTDTNRYPASAGFTLPSGLSLPTGTLSNVSDTVTPTYLKMVPLVDGWNSWFTYGTSADAGHYALRSSGADGAPQSSPAWGARTHFNEDIILVDGVFAQYPEGVQR